MDLYPPVPLLTRIVGTLSMGPTGRACTCPWIQKQDIARILREPSPTLPAFILSPEACLPPHCTKRTLGRGRLGCHGPRSLSSHSSLMLGPEGDGAQRVHTSRSQALPKRSPGSWGLGSVAGMQDSWPPGRVQGCSCSHQTQELRKAPAQSLPARQCVLQL